MPHKFHNFFFFSFFLSQRQLQCFWFKEQWYVGLASKITTMFRRQVCTKIKSIKSYSWNKKRRPNDVRHGYANEFYTLDYSDGMSEWFFLFSLMVIRRRIFHSFFVWVVMGKLIFFVALNYGLSIQWIFSIHLHNTGNIKLIQRKKKLASTINLKIKNQIMSPSHKSIHKFRCTRMC